MTAYLTNHSLNSDFGMKTLLEMWSGSLGGDSKLCIFECPMYVLVNNEVEQGSQRLYFFWLSYWSG